MATKLERPRQVQKRLGIKHSKFYQMIHDGEFPEPTLRIGRAVLWDSKIVDGWIESQSAKSSQAVVGEVA